MITLNTQITKDGVVCSNELMGKIATIQRKDDIWYVFPYSLEAYVHGKNFKSLKAAEMYAVALAYEIYETKFCK